MRLKNAPFVILLQQAQDAIYCFFFLNNFSWGWRVCCQYLTLVQVVMQPSP